MQTKEPSRHFENQLVKILTHNIRTEIILFFHKIWSWNKLKGSEATYVEMKDWKTERHPSMFPESFSSYTSMFWQPYLENKKPTFFAYIFKQVYATTSLKNKDLFKNHKT